VTVPKALSEVPAFLDKEWIAAIATVDRRGEPHAVPVWFTFDDGKLHVHTDRNSVKIRNIQHNPHVSMAVYNAHDEAVIIRGRARLVDDEKEFRRLTQAHIDKYNRLYNITRSTSGIDYIKLDAQGRDSIGIPLFDFQVRCVIEVTPEKTLFW
jgi:PPOX class probable F420-dependent enzyme